MSQPSDQSESKTFEIKLGFPLARFHKKQKRLITKSLEKNEVIQSTNDYTPVLEKDNLDYRQEARRMLDDIPTLQILNKSDMIGILKEDYYDNKRHEMYDPLRGNLLASTQFVNADTHVYMFATGYSTSQLVVFLSACSTFTINHSSKVRLPLDEVDIIALDELSYPIQQIALSPLSTHKQVIFAVRTALEIHLFSLNSNKELGHLHIFNIDQRTRVDPELDNSVPYHVEMSPYNKYEYLFVTDNGYVALVNGRTDKIVFDGLDTVPAQMDYSSRFRSCAFGNTDSTILVATPQAIKEWKVTEETIQTRTLYKPTDRIFSFKKIPFTALYCVATFTHLHIIGHHSKEPIITLKHTMQDGPPTHLLVDKISKDQWRYMLFSSYTQRMYMMILKGSETFEDPEIVDLRNFLLDKLEYEFGLDPTLHIPGHGIHVEKNEIGCDEQGRELQFYSVYRSFEDGSMHVQYIVLDSAPASSEIALDTRPRYQLKNSRSLKELYLHAKLAKLPTSRAVMPTREIMRLNVQPIRDYLNSIHEGWETISDEKKQEIGQRMRDLETPMLALELMGKEGDSYSLEETKRFIDEAKEIEKVETSMLRDIPTILNDTSESADTALRLTLKDAYKKQIELAKTMIQPTPGSSRHFQYLPRKTRFEPTLTTRLLGSLWTIDDVEHDQIQFPVLNTEAALPDHVEFVRAGEQSRLEAPSMPTLEELAAQYFSEEESLPTVSTTVKPDGRQESATQPAPDEGHRKVKKLKSMKKKKKTNVLCFK
ncbi:hypothetical protein G6F28_004363 [Rhizopus arrhizus]|nr:hypothetical protein G6F28_004363 [Rhizopus arrhizus]